MRARHDVGHGADAEPASCARRRACPPSLAGCCCAVLPVPGIYPRSNTSWSSPTALPHRLKTGRHPGGRAIGRRPPPPTRGFSPPLTTVSGGENPRVDGGGRHSAVCPGGGAASLEGRGQMVERGRWRTGSRSGGDRIRESGGRRGKTLPDLVGKHGAALNPQVLKRRRVPHRAGHACRTSILPMRALVHAASAAQGRSSRYRAVCFCARVAAAS